MGGVFQAVTVSVAGFNWAEFGPDNRVNLPGSTTRFISRFHSDNNLEGQAQALGFTEAAWTAPEPDTFDATIVRDACL